MREMKDSGIEWIGDIAEECVVVRLKHGTYMKGRIGWQGLKSQDFIDEGPFCITSTDFQGGRVVWERCYHVSDERYEMDPYIQVKEGDILISKDGTIGKLALIDRLPDKACLNSHLLIIRPSKRYITKYLFYVLSSDIFVHYYSLVGSGSTMQSLSQEKLGEFSFPIWSIPKQERISDYLDFKCAEIDALTADVQSEIETLEAYKRSVITEAVTKSLDPNVPMKDSGIEWVGEIPEHWMTMRGKYVFEQKNDKGNSIDLVLLSPTQNYGVIPQDLYEELSGFSAVKLNEKTDYNSLKTVHKGAFVISLRSFQGGFEYSEYEGVVSPAYQVFYPIIPIIDGYYKYLFKTNIFIDKMNSYTMSLRDGKNIAFADFGRTYIPIPPLVEQKEIVQYLDSQCAEIRATIELKQEQLSVLAEYKKSVIYEYVTGKKEVPYGDIH